MNNPQNMSLCFTALISNVLCAQTTVDPSSNIRNSSEIISIEPGIGWPQVGGNPEHQSVVNRVHSIVSIRNAEWIANGEATTFTPIPQCGIVSDQHNIYTLASDNAQPGSCYVIAFDRITGEFLWDSPVPSPVLDSWSTPSIDVQHQQIIVATGNQLSAIDISTGTINWSTIIDGIVVNASPTITSDLGMNDRVFITNYSFGGGSTAKLFSINIDPFHENLNPFQPGEIVWEASLNGDSSGNTAAYHRGTIVVATASNQQSLTGKVMAFDARSIDQPTPLWTFTNTIEAGFFGGVNITRGHVYASSYNFNGLQFNSNTVKIDFHNGGLVWSIPTNRTDATPIVLPNGDLVVSGGVPTSDHQFIPFSGSLPSIQYIQDQDTQASVLWDSALATHSDANNNNVWDHGESYHSIGGWTHQPILLSDNNYTRLLVGTLPDFDFDEPLGHCDHFSLIDLEKTPTDPGFVIEEYSNAGTTPAFVDGWIYANSSIGIHAFAPASPREIINQVQQGSLSIKYIQSVIRTLNNSTSKNITHK